MLNSPILSLAYTKNAVLLTYLLSYYMILLALLLVIFFHNIKTLRYLSELTFFNSYAFVGFFAAAAFLALTGLPPFFFFFAKLALVALLVINYPVVVAIAALLLVFVGWFIYLNAAKLASMGGWGFTSQRTYGTRYVSTVLATILCLFA